MENRDGVEMIVNEFCHGRGLRPHIRDNGATGRHMGVWPGGGWLMDFRKEVENARFAEVGGRGGEVT